MPTVLSDAAGPFGRNLALSREVKRAVNDAGFLGNTLQSLPDPDFSLKTLAGRGAEVRRCTYTNYCEALDQSHKQVTCKLWDREGLGEPDVSLSSDGRRRLLPPVWEMMNDE